MTRELERKLCTARLKGSVEFSESLEAGCERTLHFGL